MSKVERYPVTKKAMQESLRELCEQYYRKEITEIQFIEYLNHYFQNHKAFILNEDNEYHFTLRHFLGKKRLILIDQLRKNL